MLPGLVVIARWIHMRRRHDDRRIAAVFQPIDQLERSLLEMREGELVVVVLVAIVPAPDARHAVVETLGEHDDAAAVELRDLRGVEALAVGDADEIGAELARSSLNLRCCQRFAEYLRAAPFACA